MGNDGGSIPTRRELVKEPARAKTVTDLKTAATASSEYHWSTCPLSKRPLIPPILSDSLGRLFNKDAVIEWLITPDVFGDGEEVMKDANVKGLKDMVEVRFETDEDGKWVCPISRKELGATGRAVYLVPCGHAFDEGTIREIREEECLVCSEQFEDENVIPINSMYEADIARLKTRQKTLAVAGLPHSLKKPSSSKKRKHKDKETEKGDVEITEKKEKKEKKASIANTSMVDSVLAESKKRKLEVSDNVKSLFKPTDRALKGGRDNPNKDFMTRGYTMPVKK